jgi:hypothetical protein
LEKRQQGSPQKTVAFSPNERQRTERLLRDSYSDLEILETINMSVTPRCNYAGPLGQLIPTRSFAFLLARFSHGLFGRLRR